MNQLLILLCETYSVGYLGLCVCQKVPIKYLTQPVCKMVTVIHSYSLHIIAALPWLK
jgi:hypothetical protein